MFLAQNHPIPRAKQSPSRRPRGGGGGGGCAAAEVRGGSGRVVVPPRFVTAPCLCVALGGVACLGRRRLALLWWRGAGLRGRAPEQAPPRPMGSVLVSAWVAVGASRCHLWFVQWSPIVLVACARKLSTVRTRGCLTRLVDCVDGGRPNGRQEAESTTFQVRGRCRFRAGTSRRAPRCACPRAQARQARRWR